MDNIMNNIPNDTMKFYGTFPNLVTDGKDYRYEGFPGLRFKMMDLRKFKGTVIPMETTRHEYLNFLEYFLDINQRVGCPLKGHKHKAKYCLEFHKKFRDY